MNMGCLLLLGVSTQWQFRSTTIIFLQISIMTLQGIARPDAQFFADAFFASMSRLLLIPEAASALRVHALLLCIGVSEFRVVRNSLSYASRSIPMGATIVQIDCSDWIPRMSFLKRSMMTISSSKVV